MAKVAINTGSIGETSYRPDTLFGNEINERDIIDLRNSSHKIQDYKRLLEREFNKAVSGEVRGEEGEYETVVTTIDQTNIPGLDGSTYFDVYLLLDTLDDSVGVKLSDVRVGVVIGDDGTIYSIITHRYSSSTRAICYLNTQYGDVRANLTGNNTVYLFKHSTRKKSNTTLHCDIIGNPVNYYRGQTFTHTGASQTVDVVQNGTVVWVRDGNDIQGLDGNFYRWILADASKDLAATDYSIITAWEDLGSDWDGAGSWRSGVSGTPLVVGENGEDYIPNGSIKLSKKVVSHKLALFSLDNGVSWAVSSLEADSVTNERTFTSSTLIYMYFYETHTNMTENAVNSEVIELGDATVSMGFNRAVLLNQSLINKINTANTANSEDAKRINASIDNNSGVPLLISSILYTAPNHDAFVLASTAQPTSKILPYITRENGKAYMNLVFKEMKFDVDWGDDSKFNIVDDVTTATDDNANIVLIGQKRIELPYFIEDKE